MVRQGKITHRAAYVYVYVQRMNEIVCSSNVYYLNIQNTGRSSPVLCDENVYDSRERKELYFRF